MNATDKLNATLDALDAVAHFQVVLLVIIAALTGFCAWCLWHIHKVTEKSQ